jgi:hypothetical protein
VAAYPGFYAIPGSMEPGAVWPGDGALPPTGPAAVFAYGTPYFQWAMGTPCFQWATGDPYLS